MNVAFSAHFLYKCAILYEVDLQAKNRSQEQNEDEI